MQKDKKPNTLERALPEGSWKRTVELDERTSKSGKTKPGIGDNRRGAFH
jgi:hypothetical protein